MIILAVISYIFFQPFQGCAQSLNYARVRSYIDQMSVCRMEGGAFVEFELWSNTVYANR
jgi:hypothetical protein